MFWSISLENHKRYPQQLPETLQVTLAVLDLDTIGGDTKNVHKVWVKNNKQKTLLANLDKKKSQTQLNVVFGKNEKPNFFVKSVGDCVIHLSGHFLPDDDSSKLNESSALNITDNKEEIEEMKPETTENLPVVSKKLSYGVEVVETKAGEGLVADKGKTVTIWYEGRLKEDNQIVLNGAETTFILGDKKQIRGFNSGIDGMHVGAMRQIICPPIAAYGSKGIPPIVPPNAAMVFYVELRKVQ